MGIYRRDDVFPEWEPIPWNARGPHVDVQESGFYERAMKPLVWTKVDWKNFPEEGIFGHDRDWFIGHDVAYLTTHENESLLLIRNAWFGFPDPPEWGLVSRPLGVDQARWQAWGHFPDLPAAWRVPEAG